MKNKTTRVASGFMLVDTLVGVGIMGIFVVTMLGALSGGLLGLRVAGDASVAESLTRSQLESVKSQAYLLSGGYTTVQAPTGYWIGIATAPISGTDPNTIQQVSVSIFHGSKLLRTTSDFKVNR